MQDTLYTKKYYKYHLRKGSFVLGCLDNLSSGFRPL